MSDQNAEQVHVDWCWSHCVPDPTPGFNYLGECDCPCHQQNAEQVAVHWGHVDARPTSLHGNGAAALTLTALDPAEVTCKLCQSLLWATEALSWIDKQGDVWRYSDDDGLMHTPETAPFSREHVERKWGPLRLVDPTYPPASEVRDV